MEREAYKRIALVVGIITIACAIFAINNQLSTNNQNTAGSWAVYLIYSPVCPHCHNLREYLEELNAPVIALTSLPPKLEEKFEEYNLHWDGGVPLLVGVTDTNLYVVEGYPAKSQEVNGYFGGVEEEQKLCKLWGGTPVYEGNKYLFCRLANGVIVGNRNAVSWLLSVCENRCQKVS